MKQKASNTKIEAPYGLLQSKTGEMLLEVGHRSDLRWTVYCLSIRGA